MRFIPETRRRMPSRQLSLFVSLLVTLRAMTFNLTNSELSAYLTALTELSADPTLLVSLNASPCGLSSLHCNTICNGTSTQQVTPRPCSYSIPECKRCRCDNECAAYGDCCSNDRGNVSTRTDIDFKCVGWDYDNNVYFTGYSSGYYMKTSCSIPSQKTPGVLSPVTSQLTNITYMNKHIANCNNEKNVAEWKVENVCELSKKKHDKKYCPTYLSPPSGVSIRDCEPLFTELQLVDSCNRTGFWDAVLTGDEVEAKCKSCLHSPVLSWGLVFKNIYCYKCNGLIPTIQACLPQASPPGWKNSINSLVSVRPERHRLTCAETEWYDMIKKVCRSVYCRPGYLLDGQRCVISNYSISQVQYQFAALFWQKTFQKSDPKLQNWTSIEAMVADGFIESFSNFNLSDYVLSISKPVSLAHNNITVDLPTFGVNLMFRSNKKCCREDFELSIDELVERSWIFTYNDLEYQFTVTHSGEPNIGVSRSSTYKMILDNNDPGKVRTYFSYLEYVLFPRVVPHCAHVYLYLDDIRWNPDGSITLQYADIVIQLQQFFDVQKKQLSVCTDMLAGLYEQYVNPTDLMKQAEGIVSMFFSILSLTCLALTLLTYCMFPPLLSLPIRNMMFLVSFLFLGQLFLLFSKLAIGDPTTCKVLAVLLHYTWLSVFFWMNVCSYHMFHVFVIDASRHPSSATHVRQLVNYFLYANGTSLIVVVLTITASLGTSSGSDIGYGEEGRCFLSTVLLSVASFLVPIVVVLVSNTCLFGITVWTMTRAHKVGRATVGRDRGQVHVYMKLSTLTGMFWILSILAENLQVEVLVFVSIVLNASQGTFIFLSYMVNERVYRLWKGKVLKHVTTASSQSHTDSNISNQTISTRL